MHYVCSIIYIINLKALYIFDFSKVLGIYAKIYTTMPFTVRLSCSQYSFKLMCTGVMPKEQAKSRSKWWQSFTDVCAACVNPSDAEVRTGAVEDGHRGLVIYNGTVSGSCKIERFVVSRQEVPQKWVYCWISRNLVTVGGWVKAGNVSALCFILSLSQPHAYTYVTSIVFTYPVNLHCQCFVMMSPSFPLKVDAGGLSPQPDTPDTPVSPYLSSPDEVTASWGWWAWPVAWNQALPPTLRRAPSTLIGLL